MGIAALIVSLISLGFTAWVYFKHDRQIKQYQLKKLAEEETNRKAALIQVEKLIESNLRGHNDIYLLISNKGHAKATNLRVWTEPKALVSDYKVKHFNPGQEERRYVVLGMSDSDEFEAFYAWDDELGSHKDSVIISFG